MCFLNSNKNNNKVLKKILRFVMSIKIIWKLIKNVMVKKIIRDKNIKVKKI